DEPGDAGTGVAGVRAALQERRRGLGPERLAYALGRDHRAERHVARRDPLRARDHVGREPVLLAAEPGAEAPEAGDHLVRDQQHAALATDALDLRPVAVGR